jgi:hypothetical protein
MRGPLPESFPSKPAGRPSWAPRQARNRIRNQKYILHQSQHVPQACMPYQHERRIKGRRSLAPARAVAGRLRRAFARRCRVVRRRLGPRAGAAPDQGARGLEGEGGNAPGLGPAAEPSCGASMPAAAGRANWSARFTLNCAGLAHWQAAPGRAHLFRGACTRRDAWRLLSGGSRPGRRGEKNKNKNIFVCKGL